MSRVLRGLAKQPLWSELTADRERYAAGSSFYDPISWWYISGYADGGAGYERDSYYNGGTVNYRGASDEEKAAYDMGYADGEGDRDLLYSEYVGG